MGNPKIWNDDATISLNTNDIQEGDLKVKALTVSTFTFQIRQGGVWIDMFPRLNDTTGKVSQTVIPSISDDLLSAAVNSLLSFNSALTQVWSILTSDLTNSSFDVLADGNSAAWRIAIPANRFTHFRATILYNVDDVTKGTRFTVTGPTATIVGYRTTYPLTVTSETVEYGTAYSQPAASNVTTPSLTNNVAIIEGIVRPTVAGNLTVQYAVEPGGTLTVKTGSLLVGEHYTEAV